MRHLHRHSPLAFEKQIAQMEDSEAGLLSREGAVELEMGYSRRARRACRAATRG